MAHQSNLFEPANGEPRRVGLLAAWGRLPVLVAEELRRQDYQVSCLGVVGHADPHLKEICNDFQWIGLGRLGGAIRYFRRRNVRQATMVGKFQKVILYQPNLWLRHLPDWTGIKTFWHIFATKQRDQKDDTLLGTLTGAFADHGITFQPATDYAPELLVKAGQIAGRPPSVSQQNDIEFGWELAREMGRLDVGQSVCVKDRGVLAVEAIEGTDACIHRAGQLCQASGFTIVKVAKPQQDMRFDVPTVGVRTLRTMVAAGAKVLAIEAGRTILLDDAEFRAYAADHKLSVVALAEGAAMEVAA
jgi:hypothetical protein